MCWPGGQPRLCGRPVRPCAGRPPPAGLHLQAVCVRRRLHAGRCRRRADGRGGRDSAGRQPGVAPHRWRCAQQRPHDAGRRPGVFQNTITAQVMQRWARPVWPTWPAPWACARASWKKCHRWRWAPARHACAKWSLPAAPSPTQAATSSPSSSPALKTATARCCKPLRRPRPSRPCPQAAQTLRNAMRGTIDRARLRSAQPLRPAGRPGGQNRHHARQHRRLVHCLAPACGGGVRGWASTMGASPAQRLLGPGRPQRPAHGGRLLQQAFRTNTLDGRDRFVDEETPSLLGDAMNGVRTWVRDLFGRDVPHRPGGYRPAATTCAARLAPHP